MQGGGCGNEYEKMHMVGHDAILEEADCRINLGELPEVFFYYRAQLAACNADIWKLAAELAETGCARRFFQGDVINAP